MIDKNCPQEADDRIEHELHQQLKAIRDETVPQRLLELALELQAKLKDREAGAK
jgi:tRNA 2-selenouridine synthase SelU